MDINLLLALFCGALLAFAAFSTVLQRVSLRAPLLSLAFGVLVGPYGWDLMRIEDFGLGGPCHGRCCGAAAPAGDHLGAVAAAERRA